MHLNVGATSHKIEEEEVVHQKTSEATMGRLSLLFSPSCILVIKLMLFLCSIVTFW